MVDSDEGGVTVHNGSKSSFVSNVKVRKVLELILVELKKVVIKKFIESFSQRNDGVL